MVENLLKEKSSPFTVSSSVTCCGDGQRNGCRKVWTAHATFTCDDVVSKWRYRNWFLLLAANRKWCSIKKGCTEPANKKIASQEDYLGSRRRQREFGEKARSHTKPPWTNSGWVAWRFDCKSNSFPSPCRLSFPRKSLPPMVGWRGWPVWMQSITFRYTFIILVSMFKLLLHGLGTILIC